MPARKPVDIERLKNLHAQGLNDEQIAAELAVSASTIARRRAGLGLPHNYDQKRTPARPRSKPAKAQPQHSRLRTWRINIIKSTWQRVVARQLETTQ